jgi:Co/Zn/Cd efflux system component
MATIVIESPVMEKSSARTREHLVFAGMSVLIALVVFIGFARTYYLSGVFGAKPLAPIVHIHGAVFTCWIAILVVQTVLVGTGHTRIHRRLGVVGLGLAPLMVILGVLVAVEMLKRFATIPGVDSPGIFAVALSEIAGFAVPVFFAFRLRRRSAIHKRLIIIGTIATTTAGFGRWPVAFLLHRPLPAMLAAFTLLALFFTFDLLSTGRVHRAMVLGSAWVVIVELSGFAVGHTAAWHTLAVHVRSLAE